MSGDWRHRAKCRDEDPELFFAIGTAGPALLQIEQAKAVCRRCPVRDACLQWALETRQEFGVWGGMSEAERRRLLRKPAHAAPPPMRECQRCRRQFAGHEQRLYCSQACKSANAHQVARARASA